MNTLQQKTLFSLFHDGNWKCFQRKGNDVEFQIEIVYLADLVHPSYTYFRGILQNCQRCVFEAWENEKRWYEDIHMMRSLLMDLEISSASNRDEAVGIHCLGDQERTGGSLIISCSNILLFDEGGEEITLDQLQEITRQYWNDFSKKSCGNYGQ